MKNNGYEVNFSSKKKYGIEKEKEKNEKMKFTNIKINENNYHYSTASTASKMESA